MLEILYFKHFFIHDEFVTDGENSRKKVQKCYLDVRVAVNLVTGDTSRRHDAEKLKREIFMKCRTFEGDMTDADLMKELNLPRSTFMMYKRQLKER